MLSEPLSTTNDSQPVAATLTQTSAAPPPDSQAQGQKKSRKPQLPHSGSSSPFSALFASGGIPYTQQVLVVSSPIDQDYSSSSSHCSSASSQTSDFSIPASLDSSSPHNARGELSLSSLPPMLPPSYVPKKRLVGLSAMQRSYRDEKEGVYKGEGDASCGPFLPKASASYFSWPEPQHARHRSPHSPHSPQSPLSPLSPGPPRGLASTRRTSIQRVGGRDRAGSIVSHSAGTGPMRLRRQSVSASSPIYGDAATRGRRGSRLTLGPDDLERLRRGSLVGIQQALQTSVDLSDVSASRTEFSCPTRARLTRPRAGSRLMHEMVYPVFPTHPTDAPMSACPSGFSARAGGVNLPPLRQLGVTAKPRVGMGMGLTLAGPAQGGMGTISRAALLDTYPAWSDPPASPAPFQTRNPSLIPADVGAGLDVRPLED